MNLALLLVAVAALILLNAFFVAAEYGLVTARRTRLQELADEGNRRAKLVLRITSDPPRFIAAMQLGVTAASLGIGALGEPVLKQILDPVMATVVAVILAFLIITFFHVVVGELMPKGLALAYSERVALAVAAPVRAFFIVLRPLIWVLQSASEFGLNLLGLKAPSGEVGVLSEAELKMLLSRSTEGQPHSEAELRMLLQASSAGGEIEHEEREMLYNVFDFADKEVSDVMVPRPEVVALAVDMPPRECLKVAVASPFTRYPVYRGSLDDIVGVLRGVGRHRQCRDRAAAPDDACRPGDQGPRRLAARVPPHEGAHGGSRRRVRSDGGDRDPRGSAGGDRGGDRG